MTVPAGALLIRWGQDSCWGHSLQFSGIVAVLATLLPPYGGWNSWLAGALAWVAIGSVIAWWHHDGHDAWRRLKAAMLESLRALQRKTQMIRTMRERARHRPVLVPA